MQTKTAPKPVSDLSEYFLALAFGLSQICKIIPNTSSKLRAYLFDYTGKRGRRCFANLMEFHENQDLTMDSWITDRTKHYQDRPAALRDASLEVDFPTCFDVRKNHLPEDAYDYSVLQQSRVDAAENLYLRHQEYFNAFIRKIYEHLPKTAPVYELGIIFVETDD